VYKRLPQNTIKAPVPNFMFHSFPNHQTLKQRLSAFLAVNTMFVETEDTWEVRRLTPDTHTSWVIRLPNNMINGVTVEVVDCGLVKLLKPCFISLLRNAKKGRERKLV
jgi:hypothetical protein